MEIEEQVNMLYESGKTPIEISKALKIIFR